MFPFVFLPKVVNNTLMYHCSVIIHQLLSSFSRKNIKWPRKLHGPTLSVEILPFMNCCRTLFWNKNAVFILNTSALIS
jgi:hypothetical protein